MEYLIRFLAGGLVISAFSVLGDILRPKSFALWNQGGDYVSIEGRSMILGSLAFALYSLVICQLLMHVRCSALTASTAALFLWLAVSLGSKQLLLG
jgi:hypothetical protein